jgi:UDP-2,4-diacetamido-2,4,6-trideoxy-beta-L-altropyranose hydrolase
MLSALILRADASPEIGTGHAMRCLALAQAFQEGGGRACVAMAVSTPAVEGRFAACGVDLTRIDAVPGSEEDAGAVADLARHTGAACVAVDGYHFGAGYQRALKSAGLGLLCIDDYGHASYYCADLIANQNLYAGEALYSNREPYTQLLLGTGYALLRREFWPWAGWQRKVSARAHRVLVTLGGADPANTTRQVIEAMQRVRVPGLQVRVAVGGSSPHLAALQAWEHGGLAGRLSLSVDAPNMPELMAWADVAVSAAGTTCWELALMQLPALLLVLAENQRPNAEALSAHGAAVNLGWHADLSPVDLAGAVEGLLGSLALRQHMSRQAGRLVDGRGGQRVVDQVRQFAVCVRPAAPGDRGTLFRWANDPLTRQMSFRPEPIPWPDHVAWFDRVVGDPDVLLLVAEKWAPEGWTGVGQVRIDGDGSVGISVAPDHRGRGLSRPVLQAAVGAFRARFPERGLVAYVKPENAPSHRIFAQAGFQQVGPAERMGQACVRYVYRERRACSE